MTRLSFYIYSMMSMLFASMLFATAGHASDSTITIPVGDWVSNLATFLPEIIVGVILVLLRKLPGEIVAVLQAARVEQLLERAIGYGVNSVSGAAKGKTLSVDVGSAVIANALHYAIQNGPGHLIRWAGGEKGIRDKILARLELDENVSRPEVLSPLRQLEKLL